MGNIARMDEKLPSKCRDVSWPFPPTPSSKSFFSEMKIYNIALIAIIGSNSTNIDHSHNRKPV